MTEIDRQKRLEIKEYENEVREIFRDFADNTKQTMDDLDYLEELIKQTAEYVYEQVHQQDRYDGFEGK